MCVTVYRALWALYPTNIVIVDPPDWSPPPAPAEDDSDGSEYYSSSSGGSYEDESPGIHEGRYDTRSTGVKRGASEADPLL
jgi:hypothetical protein